VTDERELERVVRELDTIRAVAIDTSSIIYLTKSALFEMLAETVELFTTAQVVTETGHFLRSVEVVEIAADNADDSILELAALRHIPLVSEDRKLLLRAERAGMRYYNALIMLSLLILRGVLSEAESGVSRERLLSVARYSNRVRAFGNDLLGHIIQNT
jgi:hypothetical protein